MNVFAKDLSRARSAIGRALLLAATIAPAAGAQAGGAASEPLEGRWRVELTLDVTDARHTPTARDVKGEIAFDSASWWNPGDRWGRHTVDLSPFFGRTGALPKGVTAFSATDTSIVTELTGRMSGPMVTVEFMPRTTRYGITLEGRLVGDSIVGQWHRRGMDGSGTFAMNRISREPVKVAAINDPMLNPALRVAAGAAPATAGAARGAASRPAAARGGAVAARTPSATPPVAVAAAPRTTAAGAPGRAGTGAATQAARQPSAAGAVVPPAATQTTAAAPATTRPAAPAPQATVASVPAAASPNMPAATPSTSGPVDASVTGDLRVRLFDRGTKQYVPTAYQLQLSSGQWMWGDMKTGAGAEGWGPTVKRPAGSHRIVVDNFVCGDKYWFFARPLVRQVDVKPGEAAEVTIEVDLSAEPAKKSYDNPKAAPCTARPGAP